jgi:hypothetical protein
MPEKKQLIFIFLKFIVFILFILYNINVVRSSGIGLYEEEYIRLSFINCLFILAYFSYLIFKFKLTYIHSFFLFLPTIIMLFMFYYGFWAFFNELTFYYVIINVIACLFAMKFQIVLAKSTSIYKDQLIIMLTIIYFVIIAMPIVAYRT